MTTELKLKVHKSMPRRCSFTQEHEVEKGRRYLLEGDIFLGTYRICITKYIWAPPWTVVEWYIAHVSIWSKVWALPLTTVVLWSDVNLDWTFVSSQLHVHTHYTLTLTHSQETLSNTLGHQFQRCQVGLNECDVCRKTTWSWQDVLTCTRESLHPPLLSPFFFLSPSSSFSFLLPLPSLILPPPSSFLCFPSSHLPSPSSLTECQMTVHKECVDKLDKTCSEVSEGCMGRMGEEGP